MALFSQQKRLSQDAFSDREQPVDVFGSDESIFRCSNPANVAKSLLDGNRPAAMFSSESGEPGNLIRSSFFFFKKKKKRKSVESGKISS